MVTRNIDSPRISILQGLGRAGLAVLAGAAFAYMAWRPLPPPPIESAGSEVEDEHVAAADVRDAEVYHRNASIENGDRALVASESWALVMFRSRTLDDLSRDIAGVVKGDVAAGSGARLCSTAEGVVDATGLQRPRGPPVVAIG